MRRRTYKVILVVTITSMLLVGKGRPVAAQEKTPDLQMLLNLDLFGAQPSGSSVGPPADGSASAPGPSMLDQIRALNKMGYLRSGPSNHQPPPPPPAAAGLPAGYPDTREGPP
jgi:hypothetical protein